MVKRKQSGVRGPDRIEGFSFKLAVISIIFVLTMMAYGIRKALSEPEIYYSFVVVIGYDEIKPEPLEMQYTSMQTCVEAQKRVEEELIKEQDDKLFYVIIDCKRVEKE
jgi:hypothetical protein